MAPLVWDSLYTVGYKTSFFTAKIKKKTELIDWLQAKEKEKVVNKIKMEGCIIFSNNPQAMKVVLISYSCLQGFLTTTSHIPRH